MSFFLPLFVLSCLIFSNNACEFGIYNSNEAYAASLGWTRMNFSVFQQKFSEFFEDYTISGDVQSYGIYPIDTSFYTTGCVLCLKDNYALASGADSDQVYTVHGYNDSGPNCGINYATPILSNSYKYYISPFLYSWRNYSLTNRSSDFGGELLCASELTVVLYYKGCTATPTISPTSNPTVPTSNPTVLECFGVYSSDITDSIAEEWLRLDLITLNNYKQELLEQYNTNGGLAPILPFTVQHCIFGLNETHIITLNSTVVTPFEILNTGVCYISTRVQFYSVRSEQTKLISTLTNESFPFGSYFNSETPRSYLAIYYRKSCLSYTSSPSYSFSYTSTIITTEEEDNKSGGVKLFGKPLSDNRNIAIFGCIGSVFVCFSCICYCKFCFNKKKNKSSGVERQLSELANVR